MNHAFLLLGGNLGNRMEQLRQAVKYIEEGCGHITKYSSVYETQPWGGIAQPNYYNAALLLSTTLASKALMECLLAVEIKMGRIRSEKFSARNIDIDLLLYNNEVKQSEFLTLPHPFLTERRFALQPLAEIAPNIIHPIQKKTIETLLHECSDTLRVEKISSLFP